MYKAAALALGKLPTMGFRSAKLPAVALYLTVVVIIINIIIINIIIIIIIIIIVMIVIIIVIVIIIITEFPTATILLPRS